MIHMQNLTCKSSLDIAKCDFRKRCIDKLLLSSKIAKIKKDKFICLKIFKLIKLLKVKRVLAYIPLELEVDIGPLINKLRKQNYEVFVPYMIGKTFKAVKYRLPLRNGKFGIREPNNSNFRAKFDLSIIPIIGIDKTKRRIGFGYGMYDRFFENKRNLKKKSIKVFTQLTLCKSDITITSSHDIKADFIITFK